MDKIYNELTKLSNKDHWKEKKKGTKTVWHMTEGHVRERRSSDEVAVTTIV